MNNLVNPPPGNLQPAQLDYIVVDGSSSMVDKWWDFMGALDSFVIALKAQHIGSRVIVSVFSTCPGGMTPLFDAINNAGRHLRDLDPEKASVVFVTDGDNNASQFTDVTQARAILDWMKAKGWQVTFLGCDFNNLTQAQALGITDASAIGVAKALLSDAAKNLAEKRARYGRDGSDMHFTDAEKQQFGGYLNAPPKS
jgi:hypothetical protein